ncbi:MAG: MFS transporter [Catenulispora sp.]|nr:MFS transporter [Catenulispora sp.]
MAIIGSPAGRPAAAERRRWLILAVLCLSVLLVAMDNTIVNVALPTLNRRLGATTSQLQWVVDIYSVCFAGLLLFCGNIGDRVGRKRILQLGLVLFAIASFSAARSGTVNELIAARAAMGVAVALMYPSTLALLTAVFTNRQEKAIAVGVWSGVSGLAIALGPVIGGALLERFWWGSIFMVNLPVVAVALGLGAVLLPESRDPAPGRFDPVGALLSVALVGLAIWTVIEAPDRGWTDAVTLTGFAGSAGLAVAFGLWERSRPDPLLDIRFFRNPRFSAGSAAISLAFFGLFGFIFSITMYFQLVRGYSTLKAGAATLPYAAVMAVFSPLAIVIMKKTGTKVVVAGGMLSMSAGFFVVADAALNADYWHVVVPAMVLMAAGMALATGPATDAILAALPESKAGVGSAVNDTTREFGGALGVAVVGSVLSWAYGSHLADRWRSLGIGPEAVRQGRASLGAGLQTGAHLPSQVAGPALQAARTSFMSGLHVGSLTVALSSLVAAVAALVFLPPRDLARPPEALKHPELDTTPK